MSDFNISTYIRIMQKGLSEFNTQEKAGRFLLDSIAKQDDVFVDITAKMVSNLVNRNKEVHDAIKEAATKQDTITNVIAYFDKKVVSKLNPHTDKDCCENLIRAMERDGTVPRRKRDELSEMYDSGNVGKFLAMTMMYALSRPNEVKEESVKDTDFDFLSETNNTCPIYRSPLVQTTKYGTIKKYKIIQIFPDNLDNETAFEFEELIPRPKDLGAAENKIAVSRNFADEYETFPNIEDFQRLINLKKQLMKSKDLKRDITNIDLEDQIAEVLSAIAGIKSTTDLKILSYDALRLDDKIKTDNFMLRNVLEFRVLSYYHFIEEQFSLMESDGLLSFKLVASEVSHCFEKLESEGLSQEEICEQLSDWFMSKKESNMKYKIACDTIVAFFVQNCEVFHAISK
ncbi:ABC-three component system protein [Acetobacterium malicum]|uniref:ABC-three component system protein n=1 Tax=Acetobacterium malicum TaxID=52692 RepID=UPI00359473C7